MTISPTLRIRGYSDRPNAAPGETMTFYVSADDPGAYEASIVRLVHGDPRAGGPGLVEEPVAQLGTLPGRFQRTQVGTHVEVPDPEGVLHPSGSFGVHVFVWATRPEAGRQALITRAADDQGRGWGLVLEDGLPTFHVGPEDGPVVTVRTDRPLFPQVWYSITASWNADTGQVTVHQEPVVGRYNSLISTAIPLDSTAEASAPCTAGPADAGVPVLIGSIAETAGGDRLWSTAHFDGKLDSPALYAQALDADDCRALVTGADPATPLARWDFAARDKPGRDLGTDAVLDIAGHGLHGTCRNQPDRGMTGWNWDGTEERFFDAPQMYGAMWFHSDSLDDARWEPSVEWSVPDGLRSGAYALRLDAAHGPHDHVPFFVTPPRGQATARTAVLMSTMTYMAYASTSAVPVIPPTQVAFSGPGVLDELDIEHSARRAEYGLGLYSYHADGRGSYTSTWRRPILNMRPDYQFEFGTFFNFPADLYLVAWLEHVGQEYDVITDHDLHRDGADLLRRYNVVITGSHPEYCTERMVDAWEDYLGSGGRGMYLGGNGMYWVTSVHPEKPWVIEVRKGETGDSGIHGRPGEFYNATTGERGGLWRYRGRSPHKIWGTGMAGHALDRGTSYVQTRDARDPRAAWIMKGIDPDELIGGFGPDGGAAGIEMDRYDRSLGTPPHTLVLGSAYGFTGAAMLTPEDMFYSSTDTNGVEHPMVRADITFFTTAHGGAMFATSSMAWAGALSHNGYDNNAARLTTNVVRRFAEDGPIPEID